MEIEFIEYSGLLDPQFYPKPAVHVTPAWWKSLGARRERAEEYESAGNAGSTAKRCVPMMDSMITGYLMFLPTDISVEEHDGDLWFEPSYIPFIDYHAAEQIKGHPWFPEKWTRMPKFQSTFGIRTPEGFSCLFRTPSHHDLPFRILEGIVDTDTFNLPVEFPFVLNDPDWRGVIPAGTPIAQIVAFKREVWKHTVTTDYKMFEETMVSQMNTLRGQVRNGYRDHFWNRKNYS